MEDLWAFNTETVARAIFRSTLPIISAVGHETDYTISDFVADLRAPTPSTAAELVVRDKRELSNQLHSLAVRLENEMAQGLERFQVRVSHLRKSLGDPRKRIEGALLRLDEMDSRLRFLMSWMFNRKRETSFYVTQGLFLRNPGRRMESSRGLLSQTERRLVRIVQHTLQMRKNRMETILGKLGSLSPLAILQRGYSITRKLPSLTLLTDVSEVREGEQVEIRLHRGALICSVQKRAGT